VLAFTPPNTDTYCDNVVTMVGTNAGPLVVVEITKAGTPEGVVVLG
jgi:hypothetical protein